MMHKRLISAREPRKERAKEKKGGLLFEVCARRVMRWGAAQGKQVKCSSAQTDDSSTLVAS